MAAAACVASGARLAVDLSSLASPLASARAAREQASMATGVGLSAAGGRCGAGGRQAERGAVAGAAEMAAVARVARVACHARTYTRITRITSGQMQNMQENGSPKRVGMPV